MKTVEIKYTESVEKTKTVAFPWYRKNSCYFWKAISETKIIAVFHGHDGYYEVQYSWFMSTIHVNSTDDSDETEFNAAFNLAIDKIKEANNTPC